MVIIHSDCVECADGCHHCGLGREYPHYYCDDCDRQSEKLYNVGKRMVCDKCIEEYELDADEKRFI